jgi:hypothetical protein
VHLNKEDGENEETQDQGQRADSMGRNKEGQKKARMQAEDKKAEPECGHRAPAASRLCL